MEFLNRILNQIKTQLGSLTLSQKMVIFLLLTVVGISFFWMTNYAARRERVPLLNQPLATETIEQIVRELERLGEDYVVSGDRILVYRSRQRSLIAQLGYAQALPADTSTSWSLILEDNDMMVPESVRQNRNAVVLQSALAEDLRSWPNVSEARVIINKGDRRRLNNIHPVASASVSLTTSGVGSVDKLVMSTAAYVSGAVNRLAPENVQVIVNGKHMPVMTDDGVGYGDYLEEKMRFEEYFRAKIIDALPRGLRELTIVQVDLVLEKTRKTVSRKEYDENTSWNPSVESTERTENSNQAEKQQEPGFIVNGSNPPGGGTGTSNSQSTEETTESKQAFPGVTDTIEEIAMGTIKDKTASVLIPDSFFKEMLQQGSEQEPDEEAIKARIQEELPRLQKVVMNAIGYDDPAEATKVVVDTYWAGGMLVDADADAAAAQAGAMGTVTGMATRYGKHIAVSMLAMISLFMVLMMVRKTVLPPALTEQEAAALMTPDTPPDAFGFEDGHFDDGEGDGLLAGMELDETSLRAQQMLQQVREMVAEAPDMAAGLVSKWIQADD